MDYPTHEILLNAYSGAVYDVLREEGYPEQVLPTGILPLQIDQKLAGPAFPVEGHAVEDLDPHESLMQWTALLSRAPAGHVLVCQPNDNRLSHMGELSAEALKKRGILGYVVDGGCRDTDFICRLGFPVFCRYTTPKDIVGRWRAESFGDPIRIGDVTIRSGDWMFADRDGCLVIPRDAVEAVARGVERTLNTENLVRKAIMEGTDPQEAYLKYGKF